ncbi:MAG: putative phage tail protein [Polyangia bacterium]
MTAPSRDEVRRLLISLLPAGSEELYDLSRSAYIGGSLDALAGALQQTLTDRIEVLRQEVNPATMAEQLPQWEQACGLAYSPVALFGTLQQRRDAVLAVLRTSGSFSLDDIRAIIEPYFRYASSADIEILETPRASLTAAHTYVGTGPVTVPIFAPGRISVTVLDDPAVSPAGATAFVLLTTNRADRMVFSLQGPDGFLVVFPSGWLSAVPYAVTNVLFTLYAPSFAGKKIQGTWTLSFSNLADSATVTSWALFVEGIGVNYDRASPPNRIGEGLGASIFEFAVVADPAKLGDGFDLEGAQRALSHWKPAHTFGTVVQISPVTSAVGAIPDTVNAIPDRAVPA